MTPRALLAPFCIALALTVGACTSTKESSDAYVPPCRCGEPETAFEGCIHPPCVDGAGNPENPDCVCGPLSIGEEE